MRPGQAVDAGDGFVDARIVLHGAGAERVEAVIDGVVLRGEAREVADGFDFAHFREVFDFVSYILGAEGVRGVDVGDVERGELIGDLAGGGTFEDESLVLVGVLADFFDHWADPLLTRGARKDDTAPSDAAACAAGSDEVTRAVRVNSVATLSMASRRDISVAQRSMAPSSSG